MRIHDAYTRLDRTGVRTDKADGTGKAVGKKEAPLPAPTVTGGKGEATTVALSSRAVALASAADVSQNPRVAALRDQVRSGTLAVDAGKIASALLGGDEG